jgi:hypothetical protein
MTKCKECKEYSPRTCVADARWEGECGCPKCQGVCTCKPTKTVLLWVVDWSFANAVTVRVSADLFFSSREAFRKEWGRDDSDEQLVEVQVPVDFDHMDFIPENY